MFVCLLLNKKRINVANPAVPSFYLLSGEYGVIKSQSRVSLKAIPLHCNWQQRSLASVANKRDAQQFIITWASSFTLSKWSSKQRPQQAVCQHREQTSATGPVKGWRDCAQFVLFRQSERVGYRRPFPPHVEKKSSFGTS